MTRTVTVPLRWSDLDAAGHVNNATYLTLMEQARVELLDEIGAADWSEAGPVVAEATIRYLRPITRAAPVEVTVEVAEPGRTSVQTTQAVRETGADGPAATAEIRLVWVDSKTGRPTPIPDAVRDQIAAG